MTQDVVEAVAPRGLTTMRPEAGALTLDRLTASPA